MINTFKFSASEKYGKFKNMDLTISKWLNDWAGLTKWSDTLIIFSAEELGWWLLIGLLLFFIFSKNKKKEIQMALISLFSALISRFFFTEIIRLFYSRPRPFEVLDIVPLIFHKAGGSFPSGHAAFFFALAASIYFYPHTKDSGARAYHKKLGVLFFIGAIIVGLARISAGIHWPTDVLAGAAIGIISVVLIYRTIRRYLINDSSGLL